MKSIRVCAVVIAAATASVPGGVRSQTAVPASVAGASPTWMSVDAAHKKVHFDIRLAANGNNGTLNINGYGHGAMTITVPVGWSVDMHVTNASSGGISHSLELLPASKTIPLQGSNQPAFSGGKTVDLIDGMPGGQSDDINFVAGKVGKYLLFCGVPDHGIGGMWDYFIVSSSKTSPSVQVAR